MTLQDPRPAARPAWLLIGPVLAGSAGAYLLAVGVGPQWTYIQPDMQLDSALVWIFLHYLLPAAVAVVIGFLAGRRWPVAVALPATGLLVLGSLLVALAPEAGLLLFGREMTGFGAGLAWGVTAALVTRIGARRTAMAALAGGAVALGLVFGLILGALVGQALSWRLPFVLAVPLGLAAFLAIAVSGIVQLTRRPT